MLDKQAITLSSNKSRKDVAALSVPPRRAELFLERLANLDSGNDRKVEVFFRAFGDLLPTQGAELSRKSDKPRFRRALEGDVSFANPLRFFWDEAKPFIQQLWREPAAQVKESGLMMLTGIHMKECGLHGLVNWRPGMDLVMLRTDKFLTVLLYALKHVHLLRYCANPACKEPYFVAQRGSQIYCSGPCAEPAKREAKLKWWRERGNSRRKEAKEKRGKHAKATQARRSLLAEGPSNVLD